MYYIVNLDKQIVGADNEFLNLAETDNLQHLFKQTINGMIQLHTTSHDTIEMITPTQTLILQTSIHPMMTIMGELMLVQIEKAEIGMHSAIRQEDIGIVDIKEDESSPILLAEPAEEEIQFKTDNEEILHDYHTDTIWLAIEPEAQISTISEEVVPLSGHLEDQPHIDDSFAEPQEEEFQLKQEEEKSTKDNYTDIVKPVKEPEEADKTAHEELIPLLENLEVHTADDSFVDLRSNEELLQSSEILAETRLHNEADETPILILEKEEPSATQEIKPDNLSSDDLLPLSADINWVIDIEHNSYLLGISKEDYVDFLNEFIDKAIDLQSDILDKNGHEQQKIFMSLKKMAEILHLPAMPDLLERIIQRDANKLDFYLQEFYGGLKRLTTHTTKRQIQPSAATEEPAARTPIEEVAPEAVHAESICDLDLSQVKPIHFDFSPKEAAADLGLPTELVYEFFNDFIHQANVENATFINACKKGDVDTIHKTGHKLKGAASNLRIRPLAATLEEIQYCQDNSRFEPLLKKYWGQLLAFGLFIKNKS
jgi:hypothetical protein